jgi:hypothetical protein
MKFKERLAYFALGCAFVIVGQVLTTLVAPKATAQNSQQNVEFDKVTCKSLQIVDDNGKIWASLKSPDSPSLAGEILQIFNRGGESVCTIGDQVGGRLRTTSGIRSVSSLIELSGMTGISVSGDTGSIQIKRGQESTDSLVSIQKHRNGGIVIINGTDGDRRVITGVLDDSDKGFVRTFDRFGNPTGHLE